MVMCVNSSSKLHKLTFVCVVFEFVSIFCWFGLCREREESFLQRSTSLEWQWAAILYLHLTRTDAGTDKYVCTCMDTCIYIWMLLNVCLYVPRPISLKKGFTVEKVTKFRTATYVHEACVCNLQCRTIYAVHTYTQVHYKPQTSSLHQE